MKTEYHGEPGGRRHVPGRDLARLHAGLDRHPRPARRRRSGKDPNADDETTTTPVAPGRTATAPEHHAGRPAPDHARATKRPRTTSSRRRRSSAARGAGSADADTPAPETPPPATPPATPAPDPGGGGGGDGGAVAPARPPGGRASPAASGRETWRLSASQKRQGSSTAFVIPIRSPVDHARLAAGRSRRGSRSGRRAARCRSGRGRSRAPA